MKSGEKLKFVKELAEKERLQLLNSLAENHLLESATKHGDILRILSKEKRSLVVIGPFDDFRIIQQERQMRIELKLPNGELVNGGSLPCTDLKFMTLIKKIKGGLPDKRIDKQSSEINELQGRKFFFLIGLTGEPYKDTYWPMIVGLHAIPDYPGGIEFDVI